MILNIEQQIEHMAVEWPDWTVIKDGDRGATWSGILQPHQRKYAVNVQYTVPLAIQKASALWIQPLVSVAELCAWRETRLKLPELPHVYWRHPRSNVAGPFLCLFDSEARQWSSESAIAHTTIQWSSLWLSFFEGWLISGFWSGGGVHSVEAWK